MKCSLCWLFLCEILAGGFGFQWGSGRWSEWNQWSPCSRTCGGGTTTRRRVCENPLSHSNYPRFILKIYRQHNRGNCRGSDIEYTTCNLQNCPEVTKVTRGDAVTARAQQCAKFNGTSFNGRFFIWVPYLRADDSHECELNCLAKGHKFFLRLRPYVEDGTPCLTDLKKICIKGRCEDPPHGCEGGKCFQKSSRLGERRFGLFTSKQSKRNLVLGYNPVITIPSGSTNINVTEMRRSKNYLALKSHNSDKYYLNGNWVIDLPRGYRIAGAKMYYKRPKRNQRFNEAILSKGPTNMDLDLMIIYQGDEPNIIYSYNLPPRNPSSRRRGPQAPAQPNYPNDRQGVQAGTIGRATIQSQGPRRLPPRGQIPRGQVILPRPQGPIPGGPIPGRPIPRRPNPGGPFPRRPNPGGPIPVRPNPGGPFPRRPNPGGPFPRRPNPGGPFPRRPNPGGSVPLGPNPGRPIPLGPNPGGPIPVRPNPGGPFPRRPIPGGPIPVGPNSGGPFPRRPNPGGPNPGGPVPVGPGPVPRVPGGFGGQPPKQAAYRWMLAGYTPCSHQCAGGLQTAMYHCVRSIDNIRVGDSFCTRIFRKPDRRKVCNVHPCPARWEPGKWLTCAKTCGESIQLRNLHCKQAVDINGRREDRMIPIKSCPQWSRPQVSRLCRLPPCPKPNEWVADSWRPCSVTCGTGIQKRIVECRDVEQNTTLRDNDCARKPKPPTTRRCSPGGCETKWFITNIWTECSASCGDGVRERLVFCGRRGGNALPDGYCDKRIRPKDSRKCREQRCKASWVTSEWEKCSAACGKGVQSRIVFCASKSGSNHRQFPEYSCRHAPKPNDTKPCFIKECSPQWLFSNYGKCSKTCGGGRQYRHVMCLNDKGEKVGGCEISKKPSYWQKCATRRCPYSRWRPTRRGGKQSKCRDEGRAICNLIVQARFCRYEKYKQRCCVSCKNPK